MFYSHTFLARKGPLGTVWCAAHLQHKLKKSHYTSTDISSTVERIMYPEVPIALRMSGHLLLGVVRIYSKKVDYLYQDYNFFLITITKAFASVQVNLPEDATHAPFHSVTLPDTFELDALNLDEDFYHEGFEDNHLRSQEDITLTDQIPTGRDPYISITLDKDLLRHSLPLEDASDPGAMPMDEDIRPSPPVASGIGFRDPGPTNQAGASEGIHEDNSPDDIPEIEIRRDAVHGFHNISPWPDLGNDRIKPDGTLERAERQLVNDREIPTPVAEERLISGGQSIPSRDHEEPFNSATSSQAPDNFNSRIAFEHASPPQLVIRATPPAEQQPVEQPRGRNRRRRQLFDESTVLTNKFIKAGLDDYNDLRRKKKHCPSSALDVWKLNNRLRKENIFLEPLMPGLCTDLCNIYKRDFISAKPHLASAEEPCPEPSNAQPPPTCDPMQNPDMEIEHPRNNEGRFDNNVLPDTTFMPSQTGYMSPLPQREEFTPTSADNFVSESESQWGTSVGTRVQPTPDLAASTGTLGPEMETPMTFLVERQGLDDTGLSDIPEVMNSAEADDLNFLAMGEYTPTEVQGTQGVGTLSQTTRKVAQYLKGKASVTPISEDLSGDLVLNKLLEGKSRKVCARMFSETLVLKSYGLVDVQQEEPCGDITLKLTPKLFKDLE
ncbi:sister chromatid cohesion 1 protein 3 [Rhododendron vialii]|uniref:sister chromatid cohesion 1 protein 3 n=1 Tax=Rhododendron vialii TaxID=182163 RepID=UPI00265E89EC|nr:sister chromatid cohesion 1 protein 3 [Rhododendron vialii]